MKVVVPLLVLIIISALAILEANAQGNPNLWFHVFRTVGWIAIVGMLILIYEKTGSKKLAYSGIFILTLFGFSFIFLGILALFVNIYLFSIPIIIIGVLWVWFILSRYGKFKEAGK